jgi:RND family efflux transporter MFP subunit
MPRLLPLLLLALACGGHEHAHEGDGAHGHGHGHGEAAEDPRPDLAVTLYQGGLELFMEHPAFVVGMASPLIAHFTDTRDPARFVWVTEGSVVATLRFEDGAEETFTAETLLRSGIWKPIVTPKRAGTATLSLRLSGHPAEGTVEVGPVVVYPTAEAAAADAPPEEAGEATVGYLKESQWKTVYATTPAVTTPLRSGVRATGELRAASGAEAELSAPVSGRLLLRAPVFVGRRVAQGELLAEVAPIVDADRAGLDAALTGAQAELAAATRGLERARALHPAVVSAQELEAAELAFASAQARATAAAARLSAVQGAQRGAGGGSGGAFALRAPFDGVIVSANALTGQSVSAGDAVVRIVDPREVWLLAQVSETEAAKVGTPIGASFSLSGTSEVIDIASRAGRLLSVGAALAPATRTLPVLFALDNADGALKPGMFTRVTVFTGESADGVVIPAAAVIDDGGRPTVFVMEGGESFYKRVVRLGVRDGDRVQVLAGVAPGERVVSAGADEVHLSTVSGAIPAHGHAH